MKWARTWDSRYWVVLVYNIYEMNRPSPDDMKAMQVMEYIEELEEENKKLKKEVKERKMIADENWTGYDMKKDECDKLEKENKELKKKLDILYHHI